MAQQQVLTPARPIKIIAGGDFQGASLIGALVARLRSLNIDVEDIGTSLFYSIGEEVGRRVSQSSNSPVETRGLIGCGNGVGVSIFANKFPGAYAVRCLTKDEALDARSVSDCNILALGGSLTSPETAYEILDAFLDTPFKAPCPASGSVPWPEIGLAFLDACSKEMWKVGSGTPPAVDPASSVCSLATSREFAAVDAMPGGSVKILRETPTSAIVRFAGGSVEPAHHHTFGHDVVVLKGSKTVWNLSNGETYDLGVGDYLFTPAGDVHRVKYHEDTEFLIKWDGHSDLLVDEDANADEKKTKSVV